jgi:hypothetical protein
MFAFASGMLIRHLAPAVHATTPLDLSRIEDLTEPHVTMEAVSGVHPVDASVLARFGAAEDARSR